MITRLKFVSVPIKDQDRALAFYTQKLGFAIATDSPMGPGQRWIELRLPKGEARVVLFTPEGHEDRVGGFMNMSLGCDRVERTYEELLARGVEFEAPPTKQDWGAYAIMKDSEGNRIVISSDS